MHRVTALALPDVVAFDLSIPAQIFGHRVESRRYAFTVCAERPGAVPTTTGFALHADHGLEALEVATRSSSPASCRCPILRRPSWRR